MMKKASQSATIQDLNRPDIKNQFKIMESQKQIGNTKIVIIALGILMLIGSVYVLILKRQIKTQHASELSNPSASFPTNDISNWKTYWSERYGFEFKYPPDWIIKTNYIQYQDKDPHLNLKWMENDIRAFELSKICLDKHVLPKNGELAFSQPPTKTQGRKVLNVMMAGHKVSFYETICYECYDGETLRDIDYPALSAGICNKQGICIHIDVGKSGMGNLKRYENIISTIKLDRKFDLLDRFQECADADVGF